MFHKTPGELVAEVTMERAANFGGVLIIVEALDDKKFWQGFVDADGCRILQSYGKSCAVKAILLLETLKRDGAVLAIVDDDFDSMLGRRIQHGRIVYTDAHDLESVLVRSHAFDRAVAEYTDADALRGLLAEVGSSAREWVVARGVRVGLVRLKAQQETWQVSFDGFSCFKVVDANTWEIDRESLVRFAKEQRADFNENAIDRALAERVDGNPWFIVHGHDLVALTCVLLCNRLRVRHLGPKTFSSSMRVAFTWDDLAETNFYPQINAWEEQNHLRILRPRSPQPSA